MAEDFLIRVGVDYSAAVRDTRRFQKEIEGILARTASSQGRPATAQIAAQSQAAGSNYSRELAGIQRSLETLVTQSARQQDRLFAVLSTSSRNQPVVQVVQSRVQTAPIPPRSAPPTPVGGAVSVSAIGAGDRALRRQQSAIERAAVIAETRNVQASAFAAREQKLQNEILRARAIELQGIQQRITENAVSQPVTAPSLRVAQVAHSAPAPVIPQAPSAPMVVPQAPVVRALPAAPQSRPILDFSVQLAAIQRQFLANQQQLVQSGSSQVRSRVHQPGFFDAEPELPKRLGDPQFLGYPSVPRGQPLSLQQRLDVQLDRSRIYRSNLPHIEGLLNTSEFRESFTAPMRGLFKGLFNFFPQAVPNVKAITARHSSSSGTYDDVSGVLNVDPRMSVHGSRTTVEESLAGTLRTVQAFATKDIFGTAVHEFGHAVDSLRRSGARSDQSLARLLHLPAFTDSIRGSISGYATTNPGELFAESFASVLRGAGSPMAFRAMQDNLGPQDDRLLARRRQALDDLIHRQRVEISSSPSSPKIFDWAEDVSGLARRQRPIGQGTATGGSSGLPPVPPRTGVGAGSGDDDEIRRQKQQYLSYLRQLTEQTKRALVAGEDTTPHLSKLKRLVDAAEAHAAGNLTGFRQNVMSVIPPGNERAKYMLSKTPFGREGWDQLLVRDIVQQRRALSAAPVPIAIGGPVWSSVERNRRSSRDAVQRLIPPGKIRTKYLLGKDPFKLGSLDNNIEHPKGAANEEARAAIATEQIRRDLQENLVPELPASSPYRGAQYERGVRSREKQAAIADLRRERQEQLRLSQVAEAQAEETDFTWKKIGEGKHGVLYKGEPIPGVRVRRVYDEEGNVSGTALDSPEGTRVFSGRNTVGQAKRVAEQLSSTFDSVGKIQEGLTQKAERVASFKSDTSEVAEAALKRVSGGRFAADIDQHVLGNKTLQGSETVSDADRKIAAEARRRNAEQELINRGRLDLIPKSRRASYGIGEESGNLTSSEQLKVLESRAAAVQRQLKNLGKVSLDTKDGQKALADLEKEAKSVKKGLDEFAPGKTGEAPRKVIAQSSADASIAEVLYRKRNPQPGSLSEHEAKEQKAKSKSDSKGAKSEREEKDRISQFKNPSDLLAGLRSQIAKVRVDPDTSQAKAKFEALLALLKELDAVAESINIRNPDGSLNADSFKRASKLQEGVAKAKAEMTTLGAGLFPAEGVEVARVRQQRSSTRRAWDWLWGNQSPEAGDSGGSGGSGPGGPGSGGPGSGGSGLGGPEGGGWFSKLRRRLYKDDGIGGFFGSGALSTLRYGIPSMVMYGAMSGISESVKEAEEFQFTMEKVKAQLQDTFGDGADPIFESFKGHILDLAKQTGVQADVLADVGMQYQGAFGKASVGGLSGQELVKSQLIASAKLSQVTHIPVPELNDGLTAASFGFNATNEEISNVALRLESLSGVTAKETIGFIGDIAPVAKEAGFSLSEFASLAAVAQQKSGRSGTALAESFGRIIPAISQSKDQLLQLAAADDNLRTPEFIKAVSSNDIKGTFLSLLQNFQSLNKESQDFIVNLLGGRREAQVLLAAIGDKGQLAEYTAAANDSKGTLDSRFESAQQTLTNQMARLRQEFNLFAAALIESGLGDALSGMIGTVGLFVKGLEGILKVSGAINSFFGGLPGKIIGVTAALIAMRAAVNFLSNKGQLALGIEDGSSILANLGGRAGRRIGAMRAAASVGAAGAASEGFFDLAGPGAVAGGRIASARAAYGAASVAAGGGASGAMSGVGAAATALTGVSTTMLLAGGAAIAAIGGTYLLLKHGLDDYRKEMERNTSWALDAHTSAKDVEDLIKSSASDGGPGNLARIGSFFTGERLLGERDQLKSSLYTKNLSKQDLETWAVIDPKDATRTFQGGFSIKEEEIPKGIDVRDRRGAEIRAKKEAEEEKRRLLKEVHDKRWSTLNRPDSGKDLVKFKEIRDNFSNKLGLKKGEELTDPVMHALAGGNIIGDLTGIVKSQTDEYTEVEKKQAAKALNVAQKNSNAARVVGDSAKQTQTLDTIQKNYEAGITSFSAYIEAAKRNLEGYRKVINMSEGNPDVILRDYAQRLKAFNMEVSRKTMQGTEIFLSGLELTGASPLETARAKVEQYTRLLNSGKLSGEHRTQIAQAMVQAQKDEVLAAASAAGSAGEASSILSKGFKISPETRINSVLGAISQIVPNWDLVSETMNKNTGVRGGKVIGDMVRGLSSGALSGANVQQQLQEKVAEYKHMAEVAGSVGASDANIKALQEVSAAWQQVLEEFNNTGKLPGDLDPAKIAAKEAYDVTSRKNDLEARLRTAKAGGNVLVGAYQELAAARKNLADAEKVGGETETEAQIRVFEAENGLKKVLADRKKSLLAVAKAKANFNKDSVAGAQVDLAQAQIDYQTAIETSGADSPEARQAQAGIIDAQAAIRDTQNARVRSFVNLLKTQGNQGSVEQAQADVNISKMDLNTAIGDERNDALAKVIEAERALDKAIKARRDNLIDLFQLAGPEDPVWQSQGDINQFTTQINEAKTLDEKIDAQKSLLSAQKALRDAMAEVRNSQYDLRQAELESIGDEVGAANVAAQLARAQLNDALKLASEGKSPGDAEINRLKASVVRADKSAADTAFSEKKDDLEWMYQMGTLTKQEYIGYLEGLKSTVLPGTKQFKDLELQIRQLKDDVGSGLQMNLPTSLALPTLYEVRRLDQSVNSNGSAAGYVDNRQQSITINLNNGTTQADLINALNAALGTNTTAQGSTRLY